MMKISRVTDSKEEHKDSELSYVKSYTFEQANELLKNMKPREFTVSDTVLILLYAYPEKPIFGRLLFVKEIFLLTKEIIDKEHISIQDPRFVPYRYGPYSFVLGNTLSNLEYLGYISRVGPKNAKGEKFSLTEKGKKAAQPLWSKLPEKVRLEIQDGRVGWDELGRDGILKLVYQKYPEFAKKSYIKGRYKSVSWGIDWVTEPEEVKNATN